MKTFKFSLVLRTRENTDVFISLDDNIYSIHSKRVNILYISNCRNQYTQEGVRKPMYITIYGLGWRRLWANENQSIYKLYNNTCVTEEYIS